MRGAFARTPERELSADDLTQAALRIADSRSMTALRDSIFQQADSFVGVVAMGMYIYDGAERLQLVSSRLAPQGFLDQYAREYAKADIMLDVIVGERRTIDGFHFYGPSDWGRSGNYELLHGWGFHHNIGGAFVIDGRTAGVLFAATAHDDGPFGEIQVKRFDLLCRAGSLALSAMRERERLRCELSNGRDTDWRDRLFNNRDRSDEPIRYGIDRPISQLPTRSRAVATLVCEGHSNKAIAKELGISIYTVKEHVQNLCRRFDAMNRTDLVKRLLLPH